MASRSGCGSQARIATNNTQKRRSLVSPSVSPTARSPTSLAQARNASSGEFPGIPPISSTGRFAFFMARSLPRTRQFRPGSEWPFPLRDLRAVRPVFVGETQTVINPVLEPILGVRADRLQFRHALDRVDREAETIGLVVDRKLEGSVDVAHLAVASHVQVVMIRAPVGELVNQPRVAVEVEDDRAVACEKAVEVAIGKSVGMLARRLHHEQIDHVDEADFETGKLLAKDRGRRERLD